MDSSPTLHDFVLNLISDPTARSAFEIDPEGALRDAGLSDITAADVQEVIPLVVDYAPIDGLAGLDNLGELPPAGPDLDPAAAIHQLQAVTDQLTVGAQHTGVDVNVTAAGAITVNAGGLAPAPAGLPDIGLGLGGGVAGDLSAVTDPAGILDLDGAAGAGTTGPIETTGTTGTDSTLETTQLIGPGDVVGTAVDGVLGTVDITANTLSDGLLPVTPDDVDPIGVLDGLPAVDDPVQYLGGAVPAGVGDGGVGGARDGLGDSLGGEHSVTGAVGATATAATDLLF